MNKFEHRRSSTGCIEPKTRGVNSALLRPVLESQAPIPCVYNQSHYDLKLGTHVKKHFPYAPGSAQAHQNALISKIAATQQKHSQSIMDMQFDKLVLFQAAQKQKIVPVGVISNRSSIDFQAKDQSGAKEMATQIRVYKEKYQTSEAQDQVKSVTLTPYKRYYPQKNRETTPEDLQRGMRRDNMNLYSLAINAYQQSVILINSSKRVFGHQQSFNPLINYDKPSGQPSFHLVSQFEKPLPNQPSSVIARSPSRERQIRQLQKSCSSQVQDCFRTPTPQYFNQQPTYSNKENNYVSRHFAQKMPEYARPKSREAVESRVNMWNVVRPQSSLYY